MEETKEHLVDKNITIDLPISKEYILRFDSEGLEDEILEYLNFNQEGRIRYTDEAIETMKEMIKARCHIEDV